MIYLTGDVHVKIPPGNWEQKNIESEVAASEKYLKILAKYNISCTLFINGICFNKNKEGIKQLLEYDVELGGHTYNNFGGMDIVRSYITRKLFGNIYGPSFYQKRDIRKTKEAFEKFGLKMTSWRTHAFGSNNETFRLLKKEGVMYVSDLIGDQGCFADKNGLIHLPLNISIDQNTIAYGILKPENRDPFSSSCTKGRIKPEEWFEIIKKRIDENEREKIPSIILIHPATMAFLDDFQLFEKVAKFLSKYESKKVSEFEYNEKIKSYKE